MRGGRMQWACGEHGVGGRKASGGAALSACLPAAAIIAALVSVLVGARQQLATQQPSAHPCFVGRLVSASHLPPLPTLCYFGACCR